MPPTSVSVLAAAGSSGVMRAPVSWQRSTIRSVSLDFPGHDADRLRRGE
jgi:hypothetical protein